MSETYAATSGSGARAGIWSAIVTVNSVDVSARVVGDIRIDAEEDSARIAELTLRPVPGPFAGVFGWGGPSENARKRKIVGAKGSEMCERH